MSTWGLGARGWGLGRKHRTLYFSPRRLTVGTNDRNRDLAVHASIFSRSKNAQVIPAVTLQEPTVLVTCMFEKDRNRIADKPAGEGGLLVFAKITHLTSSGVDNRLWNLVGKLCRGGSAAYGI